MLIIGLSGKMGVGKSSVADRLKERITDLPAGKWCGSLAFGDALKRDVAKRFNFDLEKCYSQEGKLLHVLHPDLPGGCMQIREILQWYGQKKRREHPGYWVGRWAAMLPEGPAYVIVDDVRYPDEKAAVEARGGFCVRLEAWPGWQKGAGANHESETALDHVETDDWEARPVRKEEDLRAVTECVVELVREWTEREKWGAEL